jgi:hypothetical protein
MLSFNIQITSTACWLYHTSPDLAILAETALQNSSGFGFGYVLEPKHAISRKYQEVRNEYLSTMMNCNVDYKSLSYDRCSVFSCLRWGSITWGAMVLTNIVITLERIEWNRSTPPQRITHASRHVCFFCQIFPTIGNVIFGNRTLWKIVAVDTLRRTV